MVTMIIYKVVHRFIMVTNSVGKPKPGAETFYREPELEPVKKL